ncbi:hypothetical protein RB195_011423 [Necator americanus]
MILLLFVAFLSSAQACAPGTSPSEEVSTTPGETRKPQNEKVVVTVISNQTFDPTKNHAHLKVVRALLDDYVHSNGLAFDRDLVQEIVENMNGKFAIRYVIIGADCEQVEQFVRGVKNHANYITVVKLQCGSNPEIVIN